MAAPGATYPLPSSNATDTTVSNTSPRYALVGDAPIAIASDPSPTMPALRERKTARSAPATTTTSPTRPRTIARLRDAATADVATATASAVAASPPVSARNRTNSAGESIPRWVANTVVSGADTVVGTYSIVVDETRLSVNDSDYAPEGDTSGPFVTTALYSSELLVVYETARIEYATVVRVAPGEPDG